jgi:hypothetical protein
VAGSCSRVRESTFAAADNAYTRAVNVEQQIRTYARRVPPRVISQSTRGERIGAAAIAVIIFYDIHMHHDISVWTAGALGFLLGLGVATDAVRLLRR